MITFLILPLSLSSKYPSGLLISFFTELLIILSSTSNAKTWDKMRPIRYINKPNPANVAA